MQRAYNNYFSLKPATTKIKLTLGFWGFGVLGFWGPGTLALCLFQKI